MSQNALNVLVPSLIVYVPLADAKAGHLDRQPVGSVEPDVYKGQGGQEPLYVDEEGFQSSWPE